MARGASAPAVRFELSDKYSFSAEAAARLSSRPRVASPRGNVAQVSFFDDSAWSWLSAPPQPGDGPPLDLPLRPELLRPPATDSDDLSLDALQFEAGALLSWAPDPPLGFSGPSGVLPSELQADSHFVPVEDRWRLGFPEWDRYEGGSPRGVDYPFERGRLINPYTQNVLKGDYPIIGQHTFLDITFVSFSSSDFRQVPTPTTPFESTFDPLATEFFGDPNQYFYKHNFALSFDLFHGDAGFKPADWRVKMTTIFNLNYLDVNELGVVNPNTLAGTTRYRGDFAIEEWFVETKLADISPNYDFVSLRAGSQPFVSDFRGFIFADINRGVRLFGTRLANREQFNIIWFDQTEKETNSGLNTFDDRHQNTLIANYFHQDFIWPGYTAQLSFHYNLDEPTFLFNRNDFLVRPDPVGVFAPHEIESYYLGWAGDGHINRINISHAFYWVLGEDKLNPLAGRPQDINAQLAAVELSIDRDWARFRTSVLWMSGDSDPNDREAEGFDAIFDNPNFAGGEFSYWQRQAVKLFGVNLVNDFSLTPNLRSSKTQGQTNFVNPGLLLVNVGADADITPKLKAISNVNFLWFDDTEVLETFVFQDDIRHFIGTDLSLGLEYRPLLNDNVMIVGGVAGLVPGAGFKGLFNRLDESASELFAAFVDVILVY